MNDEFNKNPYIPENEPETEIKAEETVEQDFSEAAQECSSTPEATREAVENDIPTVDAQEVPNAAPRQENPVYTQQPYTNQGYYTQQSGTAYYHTNQGTPYNTPVNPQYNQQYNPQFNQQPAPQKPKKKKKGLKIFAACIAIVLVFALGFGVASIAKSGGSKPGTSADGGKTPGSNDGAPDLNINESPVTPTAAAIDGALTTAQIASKVKPSIVGIVVYTQKSNSSAGEGTGVIMGEDASKQYTYIITCAHVISDPGISVRVQTEDGTTYDAEIVGVDTRTDLGVLKIKAKGLPAAEFGNSDALQVGDSVYAIGNPGGVEFFGSFTGGFVSAIDRPVSSEIGYTMKCIQHDAAINPGNSGGALVNVYGQVIGINSQKIAATDYEGMGFAIPITSAKEVIEALIDYNYVPNRPKLGITYYPVSASAQYSMIAQIKGLPAGTLIINEISSDSSLANTEIRQYDMITAVDGKPLTTADVLLEKIDGGKVGDKMKLSICRVNSDYSIQEFEVEITLVEDKGDSTMPETTTAYYIDPFEYFDQFGY
ncbi:MAG: trypsin-like peptidase domain-containing protein [Clostridia bacterium]|nr:trypsin-like peptidase domain-containing protein [Clostridia bacterium]